MTVPTNPGERDDHYREPAAPPRRVPRPPPQGGVQIGGSATSGWGGAYGGRPGGGLGGPFKQQLVADAPPAHSDDEHDAASWFEPAPWLPTSAGAVRASRVQEVTIARVDGDFKGGSRAAYTVAVAVDADLKQMTLRPVFFDRDELVAWLDVVFPGGAFTTDPPAVLRPVD